MIEAPTSEDAKAILWYDMDPEVIRWSNDEVIGDREVIEICPVGDTETLTPLELPPARYRSDLKTHRATWVI